MGQGAKTYHLLPITYYPLPITHYLCSPKRWITKVYQPDNKSMLICVICVNLWTNAFFRIMQTLFNNLFNSMNFLLKLYISLYIKICTCALIINELRYRKINSFTTSALFQMHFLVYINSDDSWYSRGFWIVLFRGRRWEKIVVLMFMAASGLSVSFAHAAGDVAKGKTLFNDRNE